jgi:hypothetical protein
MAEPEGHISYGLGHARQYHMVISKPVNFNVVIPHGVKMFKEEFEDTKGVIIIRISKKNRQHNDQKKKYKQRSIKAHFIYGIL